MIRTPAMPPKPTPEEHEAIALTRLVDDPSPGAEPADAGARTDRPEIRRQVESQRRVSHALRTGGPMPPDRLVRAVETKGLSQRFGVELARTTLHGTAQSHKSNGEPDVRP